jgi:glucose-6-phosphate isomerase
MMKGMPMKQIRFDFNNMLDVNVGKEDGVSHADLARISGNLKGACRHLDKIISSPAGRVAVGLEWTRLPFQEKRRVAEIQELGLRIARQYENVIFLGIGGSFLGLKAAQDALCLPYYNEFSALRRGRPRIYFEGNNLDPDTLHTLLVHLSPKKTFAVVISKSGETTEAKAAFASVEAWLKKGAGKKYGRQIVAITDPASGGLRRYVEEKQKEDRLSFRSLPLLKGVGGRFSELNMGLLHLAVIGVDIGEVLDGAAAMFERCRNPAVFENPASLYAALHFILYQKKSKNIAIVMPFSEMLKSTADWYVQLLAESLGKKYGRKITVAPDGTEQWGLDFKRVVNTGRTPVSARGTNDLHSIQQNNIEGENNKVITFVGVDNFKSDIICSPKNSVLSGKRFSQLMRLAQEATEWSLVKASRPNCAIRMPEVNPFHWGGLLFFLEMATAFEGELLNINAFDQPGVEGYKNYMYYALGKQGLDKKIVDDIKNHPLSKDKRFIL